MIAKGFGRHSSNNPSGSRGETALWTTGGYPQLWIRSSLGGTGRRTMGAMPAAELLRTQRGVIARWQALRCGFTPAAIRAHLASGRWQTILRGVYATFSGPVPRPALLWAVILRAGDGAAFSHSTAAELIGLIDDAARSIHVTVPLNRRIVRLPGVRVHTSTRIRSTVHPSRLPPQTRVEETVLDLAQTATRPADAVALIATACGRRLTTPARIRAALDRRAKVRWRADLREACAAAAAGCHSLLESRYLHGVERAHGLPTAVRQRRVSTPGVTYDDVTYADFGVVVELDGRRHSEPAASRRDTTRDNRRAAEGMVVLRYDWRDVTYRPCAVAAEVAMVLRSRGWTGTTVTCPRCAQPWR
jgi:very-short-patch-repair endonuclease